MLKKEPNEDGNIDTKAVLILLLEDLSFKESVADNSNRNGLADEALRLETLIIESGNEVSIDSEENKEHDEKVFHKPISHDLKITTRKQKIFIESTNHRD